VFCCVCKCCQASLDAKNSLMGHVKLKLELEFFFFVCFWSATFDEKKQLYSCTITILASYNGLPIFHVDVKIASLN